MIKTKFLGVWIFRKFTVVSVKIQTFRQTKLWCRRSGRGCRAWSECSSRSRLIWVYTVCTHLCVRRLRVVVVIGLGIVLHTWNVLGLIRQCGSPVKSEHWLSVTPRHWHIWLKWFWKWSKTQANKKDGLMHTLNYVQKTHRFSGYKPVTFFMEICFDVFSLKSLFGLSYCFGFLLSWLVNIKVLKKEIGVLYN